MAASGMLYPLAVATLPRSESGRTAASSGAFVRPAGLGIGLGLNASNNLGVLRTFGAAPGLWLVSSGSSRIVASASGETDGSTVVSDFVKSAQDAWEKTEDKLAISGLGFSALILLWASTGLIAAIDKLPLVPTFFELVGLLFTGWFVYRYLLFKPDREELLKKVEETKGKITGQ